jgi:ferredoxin-thioredoxin reductase catalytic subunit
LREIERGGVSYAIDTVSEIVSEGDIGDEYFFIVGEDAAVGLAKWKDIDKLKSLCEFKAYPRTEESSTEIRKRLAASEDFSDLVPEEVALLLKHRVSYNKDEKITSAVLSGLKRKEGYCPCRIPKTPEFLCPCEEFKGQLADETFKGLCHCRLYLKP